MSTELLVIKNDIFSLGDNPHASGILAMCQICVYANSASNPLIYNAVNEQFREGFKNYFRSWIECVLRIKGNKRRDHLNMGNRRKGGAKPPMGSCTMCKGSGVSLNGTLYTEKEQQVNNNGGAEISQNGTDLKLTTVEELDKVEEHAELLTSV